MKSGRIILFLRWSTLKMNTASQKLDGCLIEHKSKRRTGEVIVLKYTVTPNGKSKKVLSVIIVI